LSVEMHAASVGDLLPNPETDSVVAVATALSRGKASPPGGQVVLFVLGAEDTTASGCDALDPAYELRYHPNERALIEAVLEYVQLVDPDVLIGFEVQQASLGYLHQRAASRALEINFLRASSRGGDQGLPNAPSVDGGTTRLSVHRAYYRGQGEVHPGRGAQIEFWGTLQTERVGLRSYRTSFSYTVSNVVVDLNIHSSTSARSVSSRTYTASGHAPTGLVNSAVRAVC